MSDEAKQCTDSRYKDPFFAIRERLDGIDDKIRRLEWWYESLGEEIQECKDALGIKTNPATGQTFHSVHKEGLWCPKCDQVDPISCLVEDCPMFPRKP